MMSMMSLVRTVLIGSLALAIAGCGSNDEDKTPVSVSDPVGITMNVVATDIQNGTITTEKNINTEEGNPYAVYIAKARDVLKGDPGRIELTKMELDLNNKQSGTTALNEIFNGDVKFGFVMNDSGTTFDVGNGLVDATVPGPGPIQLTVTFDSRKIEDKDWKSFLDGGFKVKMTAPTNPEFTGKKTSSSVKVTLYFEAFGK